MVVTFEDVEHGLNYQKEIGFEWPLVVDKELELYEYYGIGKAGFWHVWGPSTWRVYFSEMLKGNMPKPAKGDIYQRGGDVLLDPQGMVRLHHVSKGPGDRPSVKKILELVQKNNESLGNS